MAYIKKIYGMCNDDPTSFSTDVIPMVTHNGQIDMDKTITNAESICVYYSMDQSYAKPIECLRHHAQEGRELKRAINFNLDGSCV